MKTEYAILNVTVDNAPLNNHNVLFESQDTSEIIKNIVECNCTDDDSCVEIYRVTDDGDFYDGSDFDTISNFKKRFGWGDINV